MGRITQKRFEKAQEAERELWNSLDVSFFIKHREKYITKAKYLLEKLSGYGKDKNIVLLQIGSAVEDIINNLDMKERHSIDPLADFYIEKFKDIVDYKKANYIKGMGENLPYKEKYFDVIILANVLDHCQDPSMVLREAKRVLKNDGLLYLECHFYQKSFLLLSKIYAAFKKLNMEIFNICHPHMFSLEDLKKIISRYFCIDKQESFGKDIEAGIENLNDLKKFLKKEKFTRSIPAYFGMFGPINYTCFCRKRLD